MNKNIEKPVKEIVEGVRSGEDTQGFICKNHPIDSCCIECAGCVGIITESKKKSKKEIVKCQVNTSFSTT